MSAAQYMDGNNQNQNNQNYQNYQPPPVPPSNYNGQPANGAPLYNNAPNQYSAPQYAAPPMMQGSAPYAEPNVQPQYSQGGPGPNNTGFSDNNALKSEKAQDRFQHKRKWTPRDPIFLILYLATVLGFAALSGIVLNQYRIYDGLGGGLGNDSQGGTGTDVTLNRSTVYLLLLCSGLALLLSACYLFMVRMFTKAILEITLVLNVLANIAVAVYYYTQKYWSGAIIFTVIAIISIVSYFFMRSRIPFTKILLQVVIDISKHHPSVYAIVIFGLIVQSAVSVWFSFTSIAIYVTYTPGAATCATNSCSSGKVAGLVFFSTFAYLWMSQVIANLVLATLAGGVYGGWYYFGPQMPKHPNARAFKRAATTSLGSIAFGSLIVTLLELLRLLLQVIQSQAAQSGDTIGQILSCVAVCCVGCVESAVQWFNKYAYIEIALYGRSYIPAAKEAWNLIKVRGIDALINDSLVSYVFTFGAYLIGLLNALFAYLYLKYAGPSDDGNYNQDGSYTAPVLLFAALIGINAGLTLASALESGVSTIFVCLATDPDLLQERSPGLYGEIQRTFPNILSGV